jgi:predicted pyridoxine 5'-phosphate oxidase superfamily flavin-nucleotide-binding protein
VPGTLTVDAKGRVTAAAAITLTMPANPNVDYRGITQLTGDVTAPATTNGSAAATLANSGVTAAAYGDGGATRTLAFGGTFKVPGTLTVDAKGRVTAAAAITLTMPANPLSGTLAIANGGTGATTQLAARQNMGGVIPTSSPGTPASGYVAIYWAA